MATLSAGSSGASAAREAVLSPMSPLSSAKPGHALARILGRTLLGPDGAVHRTAERLSGVEAVAVCVIQEHQGSARVALG